MQFEIKIFQLKFEYSCKLYYMIFCIMILQRIAINNMEGYCYFSSLSNTFRYRLSSILMNFFFICSFLSYLNFTGSFDILKLIFKGGSSLRGIVSRIACKVNYSEWTSVNSCDERLYGLSAASFF